MKQIVKIVLTLFSLIVAVPAGAQGLSVPPSGGQGGTIKIRTVELAERNDSLWVELDIAIHGDAVNRRQAWKIIPSLVAGDSILTMPYILINGKVKAKHYRRQIVFGDRRLLDELPYRSPSIPLKGDSRRREEVPPSGGQGVDYCMAFPYAYWMDTAVFRLNYILLSSAGKEQLLMTESIGGVSLEPYIPYIPTWQVNLVTPGKEEKERRVQGQAFLDFAAGRSVIVPTFRRNPEELEKIGWAVSKIQEDPDIQIKGLYIEGYASPEGSYALNERLSRERAEALANYMSRQFNLSRSMFRVSSVAEDWQGLREAVESSDIPRKEQIYAIIDSEDDLDRKEGRLKALGSPWRTMLTDLFPALRRVEYQVDFTVKDYTPEEAGAVMKKDPTLLSQRELFLLAQSYGEGSPERDEVFELMYRLYPDDKIALINSAAQMLERGEDTGAKRYLDRVGNDPLAANNMGIWYARAGELEQAEVLFKVAVAAGVVEAVHNLEELAVIVAEQEMLKLRGRR